MTDYIYLGETVRLTAIFKDANKLAIDPDSGTAKTTLYDPAGTAKVTLGLGTKRTGTTSTYDYWYDLLSTHTAGIWIQEWFGTITAPEAVWKVVDRKEFLVQTPIVSDP